MRLENLNEETLLKAKFERALRGTTTVGLTLRDYTILAADKRATSGNYIAHKRVKKIIKIADNVAMTTAGLVADAQFLADYLRTEYQYTKVLTGQPPSIKSLAYLLGLVLNETKYMPFYVQLLLGGYDYYEGPKLYAIELFGDVTEEEYTATGSGSPIAIGVIEASYRKDMNVEDAVKLAAKAVAAATMRDAFSGEGVDVVVLGRNEYREISFGWPDVKKILQERFA